jgi:hypothetical protein
MDEGYIQMKQRELNEKILSVEQKITTIEAKLDRKIDSINKIIDDFDALIQALKEQDAFHNKLREENQKNLNIFIEEAKKVIITLTTKVANEKLGIIIEKTNKFSEFLDEIKKDYNALSQDLLKQGALFAMLLGILASRGVVPMEEADEIMIEATKLSNISQDVWNKNQKKFIKLLDKLK